MLLVQPVTFLNKILEMHYQFNLTKTGSDNRIKICLDLNFLNYLRGRRSFSCLYIALKVSGSNPENCKNTIRPRFSSLQFWTLQEKLVIIGITTALQILKKYGTGSDIQNCVNFVLSIIYISVQVIHTLLSNTTQVTMVILIYYLF